MIVLFTSVALCDLSWYCLASVSLLLRCNVFSLLSLRHIAADSRYDDKKLYEYGRKVLGIGLICPVERYENTQKEA